MGIRTAFLTVLKHTLNPLTLRAARAGRGPFSLVRHVGRTSGKTFETPVILARRPDGFVAELTYGPQVNWYRNIVAAGHCDVVYKGVENHIDRIEPCSTEEGLKAFGNARAVVLRILRRHDFRFLHEASGAQS
ncbi:nitroreductase family deazaflavin-dependent oxidoreductase [Microbacterium terrisoli]|uniref:nitroreductase family deazaflavin-dependent oxidoreductase n=1 Tax=Microbacterium terrisoli TaxID=3242192 RepID=UPI00280394A8|nr:nitroreductase family deazaflavin-dependent oxidoreductase [Microbacterium protaetiae]